MLTSCGFQKIELSSLDFDVAFIRRGLCASLVFLLKDLKEDSVNEISIKNIVKAGRECCANNVQARWLYAAGLNMILIHRGQLPCETIKEQVDATGLHAAIVQSITTIDISKGLVDQERTWVVIGRVKKALNQLSNVTNM